jgi:hypothetical protein
MVSSALVGGLFIGILSALPIVNVANCCCIWIIGGGLVASYLAQDDAPPLTPGRGARVGLLAGVFGAFIWLFASMALNVVVAPLQERMVDAMIRNARDMPPDVRAWLETVGNRASSPLRYVLGWLFHLFAGAIFATLGGALGAIFLSPYGRPEAAR